ncbi:MAG: hypothetical protein K0R05_1537 [Anaerocolumna sp.]|nr:hypothetical protein [Anaerocolumna sp.]
MDIQIRLNTYNTNYDEELLKFELTQEQEQFPAYPAEILETLSDKDRRFILILQEERIVDSSIV